MAGQLLVHKSLFRDFRLISVRPPAGVLHHDGAEEDEATT
jgi:hypothetical protein